MVRSCFLLYSYKPTLTYPNVNSHEPALLHLSLVLSLSLHHPQLPLNPKLHVSWVILRASKHRSLKTTIQGKPIGDGLGRACGKTASTWKASRTSACFPIAYIKSAFCLKSGGVTFPQGSKKDLTHVKLASARDDACQQCNALSFVVVLWR